MLLDVKKVQSEAAKELADERMADAKKKVKSKLKQIDDAKLILRNLERELADIYEELGS